MKNFYKTLKLFITVFIIYEISGCANYLAPMKTEDATLGTQTKFTKELKSLPAPKDKIVAAVYKFRDQTGQYKASSTGTTFSTAVTQGATSILIKALEESGWFVVIEREGLSDLLNERKIIRSSRANYEGNTHQNQDLLPPLLFAGVVLEGGIISYDTNILTGGSGAKYFGIGGSGQYREDRVTVYLRATSTQSGRILKTVYTTKTILSQMVDVGLYKFVDYQRLLEVETGYSYNEPVDLCVTEAIEKAVSSLIIEGIFDHLWALKDSSDINSPAIVNYEKEKNNVLTTDAFGNQTFKNKKHFSAGLAYGGQYISGDYPNPLTKSVGNINLSYNFDNNYGLQINFGRGMLANTKYFDVTMDQIGIKLNYFMMPDNRISPYCWLGLNMLVKDSGFFKLINQWHPVANTGLGLQFMIPELNIDITSALTFNYSLNDNLDGVIQGKYNDYYWGGYFGFNYFFIW